MLTVEVTLKYHLITQHLILVCLTTVSVNDLVNDTVYDLVYDTVTEVVYYPCFLMYL